MEMKRSSLFLLFLLTGLFVKTQAAEPLRHHIIVALDKAGCEDWIGADEVGEDINRLLKTTLGSLLGQESAPASAQRHLFEKGDYVSFVGFKINEAQHDMNVFALPVSFGKEKMAYKKYSLEQLCDITTQGWRRIAHKDNNYGFNPYSLVSVAKAYALSALQSDGQQVGRTFAILVSDKHYNGNNFYNEIQALCHKQKEQAYWGQEDILDSKRILDQCYRVEQNYVIKYITSVEVWYGNIQSPKGFVELYEYVPLQQNFTLTSAINYPTHLKAIRHRGGYRIELPLAWTNNESYRFRHLEAFPNPSDKAIYKTPSDAMSISHLNDTVVTFEVPADKSVKSIQLRAWLNLHDGFYNATLMSPNEESPIELGRDGLNTMVPIEYEEDATILGMRMPDFMWLPFIDDQYTAANIWKYYLPFLLLILFIYLLVRPESYKAKAEDFTIIEKEK
jgi:hypothetical protein